MGRGVTILLALPLARRILVGTAGAASLALVLLLLPARRLVAVHTYKGALHLSLSVKENVVNMSVYSNHTRAHWHPHNKYLLLNYV